MTGHILQIKKVAMKSAWRIGKRKFKRDDAVRRNNNYEIRKVVAGFGEKRTKVCSFVGDNKG